MQLTGITIPRLAIPDRLQNESIDQPSTGGAVLVTLRSNQQIVAKPTLSLSRETFESGESFSLWHTYTQLGLRGQLYYTILLVFLVIVPNGTD